MCIFGNPERAWGGPDLELCYAPCRAPGEGSSEESAVNTAAQPNCRMAPCQKSIPVALAGERLCLDHFLDEAFVRTDHALERCREGHTLDPADLEWLLADALVTVQNLEETAENPNPEQRERMLELLLSLANLHEYVAHHSVRLDRSA